MKLRVVAYKSKRKNEKFILCPNGTKLKVDKDVLIRLLCDYKKPSSFKGKDGYWNETVTNMIDASGLTLAEVDDSLVLKIYDHNLFSLLKTTFISAAEFAEIHGKSQVSVRKLCTEGRIEGAYRTSAGWLVPSDVPYPERKPREIKSKILEENN